MTTWAAVREFLAKDYSVSFPTDETARVSFEWEDGRSHTVDVTYRTVPEPLLRIVGPIAERGAVDLAALIQVVEQAGVPYGVGAYAGPYASLDLVGLVHVLLLEELTGDELDISLMTVAEFADAMEDAVTQGGDDFVAESVLGQLLENRLNRGQ